MGKNVFLFIFFLVCFFTKAYGQQFYVTNTTHPLSSKGALTFVDLSGNGAQLQNITGCSDLYNCLAAAPGKVYYQDPNGNLYSADISAAAPLTLNNCQFIVGLPTGAGLTIDNNGTIYGVLGSALFVVDQQTHSFSIVGFMPYTIAGDLAFYNGQLYMSSPSGIIQVNIANPPLSSIYIPLFGASMHGLATTNLNGVSTMFGFSSLGDGTTDVIQFDMQNKTYASVASLPFIVIDAAAYIVPTINVTPECDVLNKSDVDIICQPHASTFTFTLNSGQTDTTGTFIGLAPGDYQVTITSNGWESAQTLSFKVQDYTVGLPYVTDTLHNPICNVKGSITMDAAGTAQTTYKIGYNGVVFSFPHTFTGLDAGTYQFNILKPNGCLADIKNYTLVQQTCPPITVTGVQIQPECGVHLQAKVIVITQNHPDTYTYTFNNVSNTTGVFDFIDPGTYVLNIVSSGGDAYQQQVIVPDFTAVKPALTYQVKNAMCSATGEVIFSANTNDNSPYKIGYGKNLYSPNETITGVAIGINHFTIIVGQGCVLGTIDVNIGVDKCNTIVFPNAFTPNGDGINDVFRPNQDGDPSGYKLSIYNRWGILIFQSQSIYNGWDGKYHGKPASLGIYYWVANVKTAEGKNEVESGSVTLIR